MSAIKNVLVIGGGFSGMAAAIRMLRAGTSGNYPLFRRLERTCPVAQPI